MNERKRCQKVGHRWIQWIDAYRPPIQHCGRWFCKARRMDPTLPNDIQTLIGKTFT